MPKTKPRTVDEFRARFKDAPVGRWAATSGNARGVGDHWLFRADGTGKRVRDGHDPTDTLFTWQARGDLAIALDLGDGAREIAFTFSELRLDAFREVVLHEVGRPGFGGSPFPLLYIGPPR